MKKLIIVILFYCINYYCFGQLEGHFINKKSFDDDIEEYYVKPDNKKIKHGSYIKYYIKGNVCVLENGNYENNKKEGIWKYYYRKYKNQLNSKGTYKNDVKDSLWIYYYPNINQYDLSSDESSKTTELVINHTNLIPKYAGFYNMGEETGIWNYYNSNGQIIQAYDYTNKTLLFDTTLKTDSINHPAIFITGDTLLNELVLEQFELFLKKHHSDMDTGEIMVKFFINKNAQIEDVEVIYNTLNKKTERFTFELINTLNNKWIPGKVNGELSKTAKTIKLKFEVFQFGFGGENSGMAMKMYKSKEV